MTENQDSITQETYSLKKFGTLLKEKGIEATPLKDDANGAETILINKNKLIKASEILKDSKESLFDLLISVSAVDKINENIFESVYHLYSTTYNHMLVVKVQTDRAEAKIPTVSETWKTADWHEREAYDLMGIEYEGHPDLRRILMPNDWKGHPLRKDYILDDERLKWNER